MKIKKLKRIEEIDKLTLELLQVQLKAYQEDLKRKVPIDDKTANEIRKINIQFFKKFHSKQGVKDSEKGIV